MDALATHLGTLNPAAVGLGMASLALVVLWPKSYKPNDSRTRRVLARLPGTVVVLALGIVAVSAFGLPVETIGTRFGGIPAGLPPLALPEPSWATVQQLVGPTLSIALLCAIEALLCARIADGMIGERHDPNQELMAQGVANMVVPLFGGVTATGTVARTVTNIRSGARTPVAGIVHALALLAIVLVAAPLAHDIPMATLASILLFVAWGMGDWQAFRRLRQFAFPYRVVLLVTFLLTVVFDLTVAVEVGLVLSSLFFIYRMSTLTRLEPIRLPSDLATLPDGRTVRAYRLFGSLFFGSVTKIEAALDPVEPQPDVLVLEMHQLVNLDTTGLDAMQAIHRQLRRSGGTLILAEPTMQPLDLMTRSGFLDELGRENLFDHLGDALQAVRGRHPGATA
jgi:sulfate permease, SulP family